MRLWTNEGGGTTTDRLVGACCCNSCGCVGKADPSTDEAVVVMETGPGGWLDGPTRVRFSPSGGGGQGVAAGPWRPWHCSCGVAPGSTKQARECKAGKPRWVTCYGYTVTYPNILCLLALEALQPLMLRITWEQLHQQGTLFKDQRLTQV